MFDWLHCCGEKKMKLSRVVEVITALGAATVVGLEALNHKHKEEEEKHKKSFFKHDHIALYSSLIATGLALWELKKHHHHHAAAA
jgi:hypothetical protein